MKYNIEIQYKDENDDCIDAGLYSIEKSDVINWVTILDLMLNVYSYSVSKEGDPHWKTTKPSEFGIKNHTRFGSKWQY